MSRVIATHNNMEVGLMDEELLKELESLREENKILRDSLVEFRDAPPEDGEGGLESFLQSIGGALNTTIEQAKVYLGPGSEKLTTVLRRKMEENPVPMLLAAFGVGYLIARRFNKK